MDWCEEFDLVHQNSQFQKPIAKKVTYREIGTEQTDREWSWEKHAEIDHVFSRRKWRNTVLDIETSQKIHTDSNHYPLCVSYRRKLAEPDEK
jgi:endonuclease/exonuclease/phosphatase family metal-dependent hydrolase